MDLIRVFGWGRAALGLGAIWLPGPAADVSGFAPTHGAHRAVRYIGARDAAMGLGLALSPGPAWLAAALAVDLGDGLITAAARGRGQLSSSRTMILMPLILGSLGAGSWLLHRSLTRRKSNRR